MEHVCGRDGGITCGRRIKTHESKADHGRQCFRNASNLTERQMRNIIRDELKQNLEEAETHLIICILCLSYLINETQDNFKGPEGKGDSAIHKAAI